MTQQVGPLPGAYNEIRPTGPEGRWRERMINVIISAAVSAVFGLGIAIYVINDVEHSVKTQVQTATLRASLHNCGTQQRGRVLGDQFRFAIREELSFIPDLIAASAKANHGHLNPTSQQFLDAEIIRLNSDLTAERTLIPGLPKHVNGFADLFPLLADTPLLTCTATELLSK